MSGNKHEKHFRTCPNLNLDRFEIISILRLKSDHFRQKIDHFGNPYGAGLVSRLEKAFECFRMKAFFFFLKKGQKSV